MQTTTFPLMMACVFMLVFSFIAGSGSGPNETECGKRKFSNNTIEDFKTYLDEIFLPLFMNRILYNESLLQDASSITDDFLLILSAQEPKSLEELKMSTLEAFNESFNHFVQHYGMSKYDSIFLSSVLKDCCDHFHITTSPSISSSVTASTNDSSPLNTDTPSRLELTFEPIDSIIKNALSRFHMPTSSSDVVNGNVKIDILCNYFSKFKEIFSLHLDANTSHGIYFLNAFNDFPALIDATIAFYQSNFESNSMAASFFLLDFYKNIEFFQHIFIHFIESRKSTLIPSKKLKFFIRKCESNFLRVQKLYAEESRASFGAVISSKIETGNNDATNYNSNSNSNNFWMYLSKTFKDSEPKINDWIKILLKIHFKTNHQDPDFMFPPPNRRSLIDSICSRFQTLQYNRISTQEYAFLTGTIIHNEILKFFPSLIVSKPFYVFKKDLISILTDLVECTVKKWNDLSAAAPIRTKNLNSTPHERDSISSEVSKFFLDKFLHFTLTLPDSWNQLSKELGLFSDEYIQSRFYDRLLYFVKSVEVEYDKQIMNQGRCMDDFSSLKSILYLFVLRIINQELNLNALLKNGHSDTVATFLAFLNENYKHHIFNITEADLLKELEEVKNGIETKKITEQERSQSEQEQKPMKEITFNEDKIMQDPMIISNLFKENLTSSKDLEIFENLLYSVMEKSSQFVDEHFSDSSSDDMKESLKEILNQSIMDSYSSLQQ